MGIVLQEGNHIFQGSTLINNHIVEENLQMFFDPNNDKSYAGSGTTVLNIAPELTSNNITGSLDASSMYVAGANNTNSYFRVRSDSTIQRLNLSGTITRNADEDSTLMFFFWSDYDATGQYSNSQAFFGGKYTNYMALRGGTDGTYGTEAETNGVGTPQGNHDYFANQTGVFTTGSWQSWTSVFSNSTGSNYYNGNLNATEYNFLAPASSAHTFDRLGSTSTGTTSNDRGGDIRMGALLYYNKALTSGEIRQNLDVLNRRFRN